MKHTAAKRILSAITVIAVLFATLIGAKINAENDEFTKTAAEYVSGINVGWNLGNSLDVAEAWGGETGWGNPTITKELIDEVAKKGFNTIRIPVTWYGSTDTSRKGALNPQNNYKISQSRLKRVKEVVDYAADNGMYVIINMHHENAWLKPMIYNEYNGSLKTNPTEIYNSDGTINTRLTVSSGISVNQMLQAYETGWTQIAEYFKDYGEKLMFESFNEIRYDKYNNDSDNLWFPRSSYWNKGVSTLNQIFVNAVRATGGNNEKRYLVFTSYAAVASDSTITESSMFTLPDDPANHLIYSGHIYVPGYFAMSMGNQGLKNNNETLSYVQKERWPLEFNQLMKKLKARFIDQGIPVFIDEMGSINKGKYGETDNNLEDRIWHAQTYMDICGKYSIKPFWWDNNDSDANYGYLYDSDGNIKTDSSGNPQYDYDEPFSLINRTTLEWTYPTLAEALIETANKYVGKVTEATTVPAPTDTPAAGTQLVKKLKGDEISFDLVNRVSSTLITDTRWKDIGGDDDDYIAYITEMINNKYDYEKGDGKLTFVGVPDSVWELNPTKIVYKFRTNGIFNSKARCFYFANSYKYGDSPAADDDTIVRIGTYQEFDQCDDGFYRKEYTIDFSDSKYSQIKEKHLNYFCLPTYYKGSEFTKFYVDAVEVYYQATGAPEPTTTAATKPTIPSISYVYATTAAPTTSVFNYAKKVSLTADQINFVKCRYSVSAQKTVGTEDDDYLVKFVLSGTVGTDKGFAISIDQSLFDEYNPVQIVYKLRADSEYTASGGYMYFSTADFAQNQNGTPNASDTLVRYGNGAAASIGTQTTLKAVDLTKETNQNIVNNKLNTAYFYTKTSPQTTVIYVEAIELYYDLQIPTVIETTTEPTIAPTTTEPTTTAAPTTALTTATSTTMPTTEPTTEITTELTTREITESTTAPTIETTTITT
ncbi:MAG: glycoside hydrolase family 5 protein, partial [Acutalibacteraceae bacterium]